jgi:formamidopyrimidine-DNA glycosylase
MAAVPELPEVEVLRRSLEAQVLGDRISRVRVLHRGLREPVDPRRLARRCTGRRLIGFRRRAKYLLADLEGGSTLVFHLGMSGRITVVAGREPREPHEHLVLELASGRRLRFRDPRRFGLVLALPTAKLEADRHFRHLGIEPLADGFSGARLRQAAAGRRGPVKTFLLDGRVVAGVGNIYATEALHHAAIHPVRSVARLSAPRWDRLGDAVRLVLGRAIEQGGTTLNDFTDGEGNAGYFQVSLRAYGREGEACGRCGRTIRRIEQAGRSTFYCPGCQR